MSDTVGLIAPPGAICKWRAPGVARDLSDLHTRHSSSAAHVIPSRLAARTASSSSLSAPGCQLDDNPSPPHICHKIVLPWGWSGLACTHPASMAPSGIITYSVIGRASVLAADTCLRI